MGAGQQAEREHFATATVAKFACPMLQVLEAYARVERAKQKKKTPTKKERDAVLRCLSEREPLVQALET